MRTVITRILFFGATALILGLVVYGLMPKPVKVDVEKVVRGELKVTLEEDGKTRVKEKFTIAAPVAGNAERIQLQEGDQVDAGAVVARIQPLRSALLDPVTRAEAATRLSAAQDAQAQARASLLRSRAALELSRREEARMKQLAAGGSATAQNVSQAEAEVRMREAEVAAAVSALNVAGHQVEAAQSALGIYSAGGDGGLVEVPSPVSGRVLRVVHESEGAVQPGTPLVEVGEPGSIEVVSDILTRNVAALSPGMGAELSAFADLPPIAGHVRSIEPSAFTKISPLGVEEQRVNVVLDLDEPPKGRAPGDGFSVDVTFILSQRQNALVVPTSALFRVGNDWAVFKVDGGRARRTVVKVGGKSPMHAEVLEGLNEGDTVIIHPGDLVEDGIRVSPR